VIRSTQSLRVRHLDVPPSSPPFQRRPSLTHAGNMG
jgi:hypothetical protein